MRRTFTTWLLLSFLATAFGQQTNVHLSEKKQKAKGYRPYHDGRWYHMLCNCQPG
ncbi:MAG TPA: hypothetical protein VFH08_18225 [Chitinophagaceae bacterium]|nr:hypothetical protein [Chitinophagaceae bacterium]